MNDAERAELERQYFERGRHVLGRKSGGLMVNLLRAKGGDIALARAELERAATKHDPREWLSKVARPRTSGTAGNGYAENWRRRARAAIAEREADRAPTEHDKAKVAAAHAAYRGRPAAGDLIPPRDPTSHAKRVLADLEARRAGGTT